MTRTRQGFWRLAIHEVLPSTSNLCRTLALAGEPEGFAALAGRQTHGRGSRGRDWSSPAGNLYLSLLLRPREQARDAAQWSLLAAVALFDALASLLPVAAPLSVKWPNDLLLDGRKLAGILVDSSATAHGELEWLVIGVGANLAVAPDVSGRRVAALGDFAAPPAPAIAADRFLNALDAWRQVRLLEGFAPIRAAWLARAPKLGSHVTLRLGAEQRGGDFAGLGDDGSLLLRTGGRVHAFSTGEVLLR